MAVPGIKAQSRYADYTGENPENTVDEITVEDAARRAQDEALLVVQQPFFLFMRVYVLLSARVPSPTFGNNTAASA